MIPLRDLFQFLILLFSVTEFILTGLVLSYFETTQCKNHFETNWVKIHSALIEILSFSGYVLFFVTTDSSKTAKWLHTRNILAQSPISFDQQFLEYCPFCVYTNFKNGP